MSKVHPYDNAIADILKNNQRVLTAFRVWCFKNNLEYDQSHLGEYLKYVGYCATVSKVGHRRWAWFINDIQYQQYHYRIESNAHYIALLNAVQMQEENLNS